MYSLDSDTVNGLLRSNLNLIRRVQAKPASSLWVSTIVVEEIVGKQISRINTLRSQSRPFGRESEFLAMLLPALTASQILPYTAKPSNYISRGPLK